MPELPTSTISAGSHPSVNRVGGPPTLISVTVVLNSFARLSTSGPVTPLPTRLGLGLSISSSGPGAKSTTLQFGLWPSNGSALLFAVGETAFPTMKTFTWRHWSTEGRNSLLLLLRPHCEKTMEDAWKTDYETVEKSLIAS